MFPIELIIALLQFCSMYILCSKSADRDLIDFVFNVIPHNAQYCNSFACIGSWGRNFFTFACSNRRRLENVLQERPLLQSFTNLLLQINEILPKLQREMLAPDNTITPAQASNQEETPNYSALKCAAICFAKIYFTYMS
jgi:hypothetical protein